MRNIRFMLHEVLQAAQLNQYPYYADYDEDAFNMALEAARQIGDQYLFPYYREMDKKKAYFDDGVVHTHECLGQAIRAMGEGGWISAHDTYEAGGQQMPYSLLNAAVFIFSAANANIACHPFLTTGAANLIRAFGSEELHQTYVQPMYSGAWQGTMALTEPQAGSSLSDITTVAEPAEDGNYYRLRGQKIYISGGDHQGVDNVVHLLLARIKGAPAGTRGISLFVVPKRRPENGHFRPNDVTTAGIYGKMGQKGYVAAHLMFGEQEDCRGYLVGEPNKGLKYMFQMMNEARIGTGLVSAGTASAAYYASLQYAKERPQGRHPDNKDVGAEQVPIIQHADVKRMLLYQKSIVEGSLALLLHESYLADLAKGGEGEAAQRAHMVMELLTPIAKSFPSEMGVHAVSQGMQVLGGAGYTDDFPLEQYLRDIRVNTIYEGTTGIHGLDLLGRKVMQHNGQAMIYLMEMVQNDINAARQVEALRDRAEELATAAQELHQVTMHLVQLAMKEGPRVFLADATLYLEYFGYIVIAWQWLKQAQVASWALAQELPPNERDFYEGKLQTCAYFFAYELPKTCYLQQRLLSEQRITLDTKEAQIN